MSYHNTLLREALFHLNEHDKEYQHVTPQALKDNIIDYLVDEWHRTLTDVPLHVFLGMTGEEYSQWLKGD